jgi:hypothetical protein
MDAWLLERMMVEAGVEPARQLVAFWENEAQHRYVDPYNIAAMRVAIGDEAGALAHLQRAVRDRSPSIFFLNVEPWFSSIRQRPWCRDLLRTMNLQ